MQKKILIGALGKGDIFSLDVLNAMIANRSRARPKASIHTTYQVVGEPSLFSFRSFEFRVVEVVQTSQGWQQAKAARPFGIPTNAGIMVDVIEYAEHQTQEEVAA